MADWNNFYVATAGAAAALTGLIFVGISINLSKILQHKSLPARASLALTLLMVVLLLSVMLLMPEETMSFKGYLVCITGLIAWFTIITTDIKIYKRTPIEYRRQFILHIAFDQAAVLPYIAGGIITLFISPAGLYWVAAGFIFSFVKAVLDAWVLLIEILR